MGLWPAIAAGKHKLRNIGALKFPGNLEDNASIYNASLMHK